MYCAELWQSHLWPRVLFSLISSRGNKWSGVGGCLVPRPALYTRGAYTKLQSGWLACLKKKKKSSSLSFRGAFLSLVLFSPRWNLMNSDFLLSFFLYSFISVVPVFLFGHRIASRLQNLLLASVLWSGRGYQEVIRASGGSYDKIYYRWLKKKIDVKDQKGLNFNVFLPFRFLPLCVNRTLLPCRPAFDKQRIVPIIRMTLEFFCQYPIFWYFNP